MATEGILATIEFQMSLLLFVALAGYLIAYRINQSAVVGIILAGIIAGPSVLGLVTYTDFVSNLGHLGAVVLLFSIGLHFNIKEIVSVKYLFIAILGILVPWVTGFYLAKPFDFDTGASIFIATALTATSIAITANVLKEMGKLGDFVDERGRIDKAKLDSHAIQAVDESVNLAQMSAITKLKDYTTPTRPYKSSTKWSRYMILEHSSTRTTV